MKKAAEVSDESVFADWVDVLLDQALLAERGTLEDPNLFIRKINELLLK